MRSLNAAHSYVAVFLGVLCWAQANGHEWESREVLEFPEVLVGMHRIDVGLGVPSFRSSYDLYGRDHHSANAYPGLYHTSFYVPALPSAGQLRDCLLNYTLDELADARRYGVFSVRAVSVLVNRKRGLLEFRLKPHELQGLRREARRLLHYPGALVVRKPIPHDCMFVKGDPLSFYIDQNGVSSVWRVAVNLSPEAFAVYRPSRSAAPHFAVPAGALFDSTFVSVGVCLLATRVRAQPEELVLEASLRELRVKQILGGGRYRLLHVFRWADCRCTPQKLREIAYWLLPREEDSVVLVHTGRAPGQTDAARCQSEPLRRYTSWDAARAAPGLALESPLLAP
ncbi:hypothetical protein, conserved [Eimeria necatrix]|uniref:Uncharacterized protein n=1 Tax=Eimeria necatrix TaxID=51315 RepID=U6MX61_9EIME|nr:hypothetical protein, conserved [Eimeria necatrix]CDJ67598.1 hypothetical protein, conserved [Eimeria necatrix]